MKVVNNKKIMKTMAIFILLALLAGCGAPASAPAPTVDTQALRTEVAQTVIANPTIQTALNPPASTATTQPTDTQAPAAVQPTETTAPATAVPSFTPAAATVTFTPVPTQGSKVVLPTVPQPDQALLMYAKPAAYTHFQPGDSFDAVWTFKNVGMKTWTNEYFLTFDGGKDMPNKGGLAMVSGKVHPGSTTQLVIDMKAPSAPGTYTARFSFYNDNRFVFGTFYIIIIVD